LFGERWDELLRARVGARFGAAAPESMSSGQGWKLVEELLNRLAVAAIAEMHQPPIHRWEIEPEVEVQRKRFFPGPVMEAP
jgi:hypothetical protein